MKYEKLKIALLAGHNISFIFEPYLCYHTHKEANHIMVTGRQCIENYMIYKNTDSIESIAFSTQHLTITNNIKPVIEISKYVIRNTELADVTIKVYFLSPLDYSFLKEPLIFEGQLGNGFKFFVRSD
ncbi:hypothetical protein HX52_18765 [Salmonella enterica]|uniref:VirK family protein n=1 Tax=Salmonella enterica TaxID=28901 RepID=UPI0009ABF1C7|nr:VirK family protein [Salmonella enterica]EBW2588606.1 hypothetical protein [Salmonella enterica subsp. enterica serovar Typhimurium]EDU6132880.1 hypothetical protein [Salmonella enterica subsp. enterica]EAW8184264.1 hypothetical protein [Salmonella enterica]EBL7697293.1 hypothetical protein [Salmonella enterica]EBW4335960.1 hypothetical protein [Salmonella enterica subsp. enterica serovar Typhimurium]